MKGEAVSALRSKRGLRPAGREAEPHPSFTSLLRRTGVVGLAPQTTLNDRKANTMNAYLLRDPNTVEPQKQRPSRSRNFPPRIPAFRHFVGARTSEFASYSPENSVHGNSEVPLLMRNAWYNLLLHMQQKVVPLNSQHDSVCVLPKADVFPRVSTLPKAEV